MADLKMHNTSVESDWKPQHENESFTSGENSGDVKYSNSGINKNYDMDWVYDDYNYFRAEIHEEFLSSIHQHTSAFAVFLSVWSFIINILVIIACLRNKESKLCGYYSHIVNFSVSNILISVFVLPLTIYHIQIEWSLGQTLCRIYVISDVLLPFTSITIIVILNVERIMSIIHPNLHSWIFLKTFKSVTICMAWIIGLVVVIPIWTSGTIPYDNRPGECIVLISKESAVLCPLITYFIPLICIVALTFRLLLLKIQLSTTSSGTLESTRMSLKNYQNQQNDIDCESECSPMSRPLPSTSSMPVKEKKDDIVALCTVNTIFTAMWFPFQFISFLLSFCQALSCVPSIGLNQVLTWVAASSSGVVPLFWFIDSQLRAGLRIKAFKRSDLDSEQSSHSEETFL